MMEAGRELDIEVAEKIMEWKQHPVSGRWWPPEGHPLALAPREVPPYSTDWAAMKLVVEKMRERGWARWSLDAWPDDGTGLERFDAWFGNGREPGTSWISAATAPLACCLAALKALGHKVDAQ